MIIYSEVAKDGRVTIPIAFRKEFDIRKGDKLAFRQDNGVLEILTQDQLLEEAQAAVRQFVPENVSLTEELFTERKREALQEEQEFAASKKLST